MAVTSTSNHNEHVIAYSFNTKHSVHVANIIRKETGRDAMIVDLSYPVHEHCGASYNDVYVVYYFAKEAEHALPGDLRKWLSAIQDNVDEKLYYQIENPCEHDTRHYLLYACDGIPEKYANFVAQENYRNISWMDQPA